MTRDEITAAVVEILADEPNNLTEGTRFREDLDDADCIIRMDLIIRLENRFGLNLPDSELRQLKTVGDVVNLVIGLLPQQAS